MNIHEHIKQHHDSAMNEVAVPQAHKEHLKTQLHMKKEQKIPRIPLYLTVAGMTAFVVATGYQLPQSDVDTPESQNTLTSAVTSVFSVPRALAASFENTFSAETISQAFGLGNTDTFTERKITLVRNEFGAKEEFGYTLTGFEDNVHLSITDANNSLVHESSLSRYTNEYCQTTEEDSFCKPLAQVKDNYANGLLESFSADIDSNWIKEVKGEQFYSPYNGKSVAVSFVTENTLPSRGATAMAYEFPGEVHGGDMFTYKSRENPLEEIYINAAQGQQYVHGRPFSIRSSETQNMYFQFFNGEQYSDIYEYNTVANTFVAVAYADVKALLKETALQAKYAMMIEPVEFDALQYIMDHPELYEEAQVLVAEEQKAGARAQKIRVTADEDMKFQLNISIENPLKYVDIWYDLDSPRILGYEVLGENEDTIVRVDIEDSIRTDDPETFFK